MKALIVAALAMALSLRAEAAELTGPARFCGYSPIIDLEPSESITTLDGGIHGGRFRWDGPFGALDVRGMGWAARPRGRIVEAQTGAKPARFAQRRVDGRYEIAIWNGVHGAAYFSAGKPLTEHQIGAIRRVTLYGEGETPSGCALRTSFSWN